jgi:hypothetical protein
MSFRATYYYRGQAAAWTFMAFLAIYPNVIQYHLQFLSVLSLIIAGAIVGGGVGSGLSRVVLRRLEMKGEMRMSISMLLIAIGALFVVASALLLFSPNAPLDVLYLMLAFVFPMPAANFAVLSLMFSDWERRNRRRIYTIT